ncbi:MAG TPA: TonB-dependent receptor [Steroidobacter sp.]|uniref:TonB-dependent receptor n=1 Tax=Steroidobacter sp. TaxID=1978227 RepID=UPI002EDAF294
MSKLSKHSLELRGAVHILLAGAIVAGSAHAQEAGQNTASESAVEEVVVTGYRESLEQSLEIKKATAGAVDAIFAEDIADFPDTNLAESVQRVPGVSIDRVGGEGRQISIRGLSPEFSRVRINGMEALTTTSATDAVGTNRTRAFDFNVFASELFNQIAVRKTSSAEVDEGSLGATIDLFTARPLDFEGFKFVSSYQQGYNELSDKADPRAVALVSMSNDSKTFGALFSVAYSQRQTREEGMQSGGWERNGNTGADRWQTLPAGLSPEEQARVNNSVHARFPRYVNFEHDQDRLGLTGSLQWQATDTTLLSFDVLHSKLDAERTEPFIEAISHSRANASGRGATDVLDYEIDENGTMVYGVFNDVDVRSENRLDEWNTTFNQYSLTLDQEIGDRVKINALVGTSKSELEVERATTIILENFDSDNFVYDFRGNDQRPFVSYGFDISNPANWTLSEVRERPSDQTNEFDTARIETAFELNDTFTLKGGVSWKEYGFDVTAGARDTTLTAANANCSVAITSALGRQQGYGDNDLAPGMAPTFFVADVRAVANAIGLYNNDACFPLRATAADVRSVTEEDLGYHVQVDFNTTVFDMPLRGDVGVRYVETDLASTGLLVGSGQNIETTVNRKYDDTLPAVNLVLEPIQDFLVRAAYSKVMSRPPLGNLSPGIAIGGFATPPTVTVGNPDLDPFRADAYDLSFEWYFSDEGLLALALFRKDIDSFVATQSTFVPWVELGYPDSLLDQVPAGPEQTFEVRRPINGRGGKLEGFEIQFQQPFTFGPAWLNNFGTILNYTNVESKVNFAGEGEPPRILNLVGLSEQSANATLYYDNDIFSARVSVAYRDSFMTNAFSRVPNDIDFTDESTYVDFSTSYKINDHFKVSLEALNLTDEYRTDLMDSNAERINNYVHTGRQYYLGLQYSL